MTPCETSSHLRRMVYALLIVVAGAMSAGRVLASHPFGANDLSRWVTVRTLVDSGTYAIGERHQGSLGFGFLDTGPVFEPGWQSIDVVLHPANHRFYSSKPPLLSTIVAGEYWLIRRAVGWDIVKRVTDVTRTILAINNVVPFALYLIGLAWLAERYGTTEWGRIYVVAAGALGTPLLDFQATLTNHTLAAYCALAGIYATLGVLTEQGEGSPWPLRLRLMAAGFFTSSAAAFELPAAAFAAGAMVLLLMKAPRRALCWALPAATVPVLAFFATNVAALGQWMPAYGELFVSKRAGAWYAYNGSYWLHPTGVDALQEGKATYAFNLLLGHHGLFSLTPVFLLAPVGMFIAWRSRKEASSRAAIPMSAYALMGFVVAIVSAFYIAVTHNYGGLAVGPRWLLWLTPLLLISGMPAIDRLAGTRWGRIVALTLLAFSVLSAAFTTLDPWTSPWLAPVS